MRWSPDALSTLSLHSLTHPPGQVPVRPVRDRRRNKDGRGGGRAPDGRPAIKPEGDEGGHHGEAGKGQHVGRRQQGLPPAAGRRGSGGDGPCSPAGTVRGLVGQAPVVVGPAVDGRVEGFLKGMRSRGRC